MENELQDKISEAADEAAQKVGARGAILVAFVDVGGFVEVHFGGSAPMPLIELWHALFMGAQLENTEGAKH